MEQIILNSEQEVFEKILSLQGDETLFFRLDKDICNDLKYVGFKKEGLQNSVMSYINATNEAANLVNFEKFSERVAELTVEENILKENILRKYTGEHALRYLTSALCHHMYTIDHQNAVLSIQRNGTCTAQSHIGVCTCV